MGIRDVLNRTDAGFVSLHSVLLQMADSEGVTYKEAAMALVRLLREAKDNSLPRPCWYCYDEALGAKPADSRDGGWRALEWAANNCNPDSRDPGLGEILDDDIPF